MLDSTFGISGKVTTDFFDNDEALAVALQPDGKIVVVGKTQLILLRNNIASPVQGPVSLVLDNLSDAVMLLDADGNSACGAPLSSPYVKVNTGRDNVFSPGEMRAVLLRFANPNDQPITYSTRV